MSIRTTSDNVKAILGQQYNTGVSLDLSAFILSASTLVDFIVTKDTAVVMSSTSLEVVERWLTAHLYAHADQLLQQKSTGQSSGTFQGQTAMCLQSTQYGQMAMMLDVTGTLAMLNQQALTGLKKVLDIQVLDGSVEEFGIVGDSSLGSM